MRRAGFCGFEFHDADQDQRHYTTESESAYFGVGPVPAGPPADEFGVLEQLEVVLDAVFGAILLDDPSGFGLGIGRKQKVLSEMFTPFVHFVRSADNEFASLAAQCDALLVMAFVDEARDSRGMRLGRRLYAFHLSRICFSSLLSAFSKECSCLRLSLSL